MKSLVILLLSFSCSLPVLSTSSYDATWTSNATIGMAVNTTSGSIVGHANDRYATVSEYLAIPFAQPPVNDLRFARPQTFNGSQQIIASNQPPSCPQAPATVNASQPQNWQNIQSTKAAFANHTSEDCLYLGVWTKYPFLGASLKPVMIFIYGGGFHSGGAADTSEQGAIFAEQQDVVLVNFNYRLGIFGFSGAPGLTQNVGLLDQRLAVEWVRDNIAGFGGDPNRITIFGHSAGGASTDYYNYAWVDDPIIQGSIIMSGTTTSFGNRFPNTSASVWETTVSLVDCNSTSESSVVDCMRSKPVKDLFTASQKASEMVRSHLSSYGQLYAGVTGTIGPTIDNVTVFENYTDRAISGSFIQRPILTGSNNAEGCFFVEQGQITVAQVPLIDTTIFTCPIYHAASFRALADVPSWRYYYSGAYPNVEIDVCPDKPWHGQEVYVLFGSTREASQENVTKAENDEGWYLREALTAFARDPQKGLRKKMGWPMQEVRGDTLIALGLNDTLVADEDAKAIDADCKTKLRYGAPNF